MHFSLHINRIGIAQRRDTWVDNFIVIISEKVYPINVIVLNILNTANDLEKEIMSYIS